MVFKNLRLLNQVLETQKSPGIRKVIGRYEEDQLWETVSMIDIKRLYTVNVYYLMSLEISLYLWNRHHNQCSLSSPEVSSCPLYLLIFLIRTLNIRSTLLANFGYYNIVLLALDAVLYSRSPEVIYLNNWSFVSFDHYFPISSSSSQPLATPFYFLFLWVFDYFRFHVQVRS